jgi:hypothetical protein
MHYLFALFIGLITQTNMALALDYDDLWERASEFDRKKLSLSGIVSDAKFHNNGINSFWTFKLSKTTDVKRYIYVTVYQAHQDTILDNANYIENEIIDLEGEFRANYEEIESSKKIGDLYVNKENFSKLRIEYTNNKRATGYVTGLKNEKTILTSISDIAVDYIESDEAKLVVIQGHIHKIDYVQDQSGNEYWAIILRDYLLESEKIKRPTQKFITIKYYQIIGGIRYADINNLDELLKINQKINLIGRYIFKEKDATDYELAFIEPNFIDHTGQYNDYFIRKDQRLKAKNRGTITNANNDLKINNQRISTN